MYIYINENNEPIILHFLEQSMSSTYRARTLAPTFYPFFILFKLVNLQQEKRKRRITWSDTESN